MKKFVNIFCILILLCGVGLYAAKLECRYAEAKKKNAQYDSEVSADIAAALKDKEFQDIISNNHKTNDNALIDSSSPNIIPDITTIFDNFFDVYKLALANHNRAKNLEMKVHTGSAKATGSFSGTFSGFNVTIYGQPAGWIQRNASGEAYMRLNLYNLEIPYLNGTQTMHNEYYFSGSRYWVSQYYIKKNWTKKTFYEHYHYNLGDFISDINPDTVTVNSFSYDKLSERYTAKITFKKDSNGKLLGEDEYQKFCEALTDNIRTGVPKITFKDRTITFIISRNCQFLAMTTAETWHGDLTWIESNLNLKIKLDLDLAMLWTFTYPKTLKVDVYKF